MSEPIASADEILVREEGRAGLLTLNRPKTLNALTLDMIQTLEKHYLKWAKTPKIYGIILDAVPGRAFCGGGDIRTTFSSEDPEFLPRFFREEYQHNWTLERFTKPNVALINGIVMGGGVGISLYGTHRIAGEALRFAMPETGIGFFPDIGGSYFLPHFPGETGMYLGLTGNIIERPDAFYLGLATHCIDSDRFDAIRSAMVEGDPIDPVLDGLHSDPEAAPLAALQPTIDRIFSASSVEEILTRLDSETGPHADWAGETASTIRTRCPFSLKVTFQQLRRGRELASLKEALNMEFRLMTRLAARPDIREGIRAQLVDRDRSPKWQPDRLEDVSDAEVEACFAPLNQDELELNDRWTLVE